MPSSETFSIKPIRELLGRWLKDCEIIIDPFARNSEIGTLRNDLNPHTKADFHLDVEHFAHLLVRNKVIADAIVLDPPFSPRQIKECYQAIGIERLGAWESNNPYGAARDLFAQIIKPGGIAISCGWNSTGFGERRGFVRAEILLVGHGGSHNDTIVTVERKAVVQRQAS
jgi:hypothetical protein